MSFPVDLVHFRAEEFRFPDLMDASFLRWLDRVRQRAGVPFQITNDARLPNTMPTGASKTSLHKRGRAVDLRSSAWTSAEKWKIISAIVFLAADAPGHVELETVFSEADHHWHVGVDEHPNATHEFIESDE